MTQLTGIGGNRMSGRLTYDVCSTVAGATRFSGLTVIERYYEGEPTRTGGMAQVTRIGG